MLRPPPVHRALASLLDNYSYSQRIILWVAYMAITALALFNQRHRPYGKPRAMVALQVVLGNLLVPLLFNRETELITTIVAVFVTTWMASFKVLGWILNRGSLVLSLTPVQFLAVYACPITPATVGDRSASSGGAAAPAASSPAGAGVHAADSDAADDPQAKIRKAGTAGAPPAGPRHLLAPSQGAMRESLTNFLAKCAGLGAICWALRSLNLPHLALTFLCGMGLYCFLGMLMDGPATLATSAIGLAISPHFDRPYLATSVGQFWNKRWNLASGGILRFLVYDPAIQGRLIFDPRAPQAPRSLGRRAAAVCATFLVSGFMHELVFWYIARRLSPYWLAYFAVQGPIVLGEGALLGALRARGVRLPDWLSRLLTILQVVVVADQLFMPDIDRLGITPAIIQHIWASLTALPAAALEAVGMAEAGWAQLDMVAAVTEPVG